MENLFNKIHEKKENEMTYDFLVAGFPKCGTTTFHNLLQQHPQIYLPKEKETFYFSDSHLYKNKGNYLSKRFYRDIFPGQKVGGVEPSFAKYGKRIMPYIGENTKIIFLVRNPIDYLFSFYKMCMSFGSRPWYDACNLYENFSGIMKNYINMHEGNFRLYWKDTEIASAIAGGRYIRYIREWERIVGAENIKVIIFEDFIKNEIEIIEKIFQIIGVKNHTIETEIDQNKSETIMPNSKFGRVLLEKREYLHHTYLENRKPLSSIGIKFCYIYYKLVPHISSKPILDSIDKKTWELLYGYYNKSVRELAEFMDVDLIDKWNWRNGGSGNAEV